MSRREQILLVVGLAIVVVLGFYYLIYTPRATDYRRLVGERDTRQARLEQMQQIAAQAAKLEKRYADLQSFIATIEAKLPTEKEVPALLVQMERLVTRLKVDLLALRPGAVEAVAASAPAQSRTTQTGGQRSAPPAGQAQGKPEYYRFPIGMTFTATYAEFVSLMSELRDFPRLIAITRIAMSPVKLPELSVQADTETYVLPKEAP